MNSEEKFSLYLTVLRFLVFKVTDNLVRIYMHIDAINNKIFLTAFYRKILSSIDIDLLDDIVTNSQAHIPKFNVYSSYKLLKEYKKDEIHDFVVFATAEDI